MSKKRKDKKADTLFVRLRKMGFSPRGAAKIAKIIRSNRNRTN